MEGKVCNVSGNKTLAVNRSLTKDEAIVITTALDKIISDYSRFKETKEEVRWYEYNLTEEKRRKFFTHWGAMIFIAYLEAYENAEPVIYKI